MRPDMLQDVHAKLRGRGLGEMAAAGRRRLWSDIRSYGLLRDLDVPFDAPQPAIPITVRPLQESDVPALFAGDRRATAAERADRNARLRMYREGLTTCWVAVTDDGEPCYAQWLIGPDQNERLYAHFSGIFPTLRPGQALLEGAYTPAHFRGKKIMPAAMSQIAEQGRDIGARRVLTFVDMDNVPSLKGCARAGFAPFVLREQSWRAFRHHVEFRDVPADHPSGVT